MVENISRTRRQCRKRTISQKPTPTLRWFHMQTQLPLPLPLVTSKNLRCHDVWTWNVSEESSVDYYDNKKQLDHRDHNHRWKGENGWRRNRRQPTYMRVSISWQWRLCIHRHHVFVSSGGDCGYRGREGGRRDIVDCHRCWNIYGGGWSEVEAEGHVPCVCSCCRYHFRFCHLQVHLWINCLPWFWPWPWPWHQCGDNITGPLQKFMQPERDVVVANDVNSSVENVVDDNVLLPVTAGGFRFNGGNGNLCL